MKNNQLVGTLKKLLLINFKLNKLKKRSIQKITILVKRFYENTSRELYELYLSEGLLRDI